VEIQYNKKETFGIGDREGGSTNRAKKKGHARKKKKKKIKENKLAKGRFA